MSMQPSDPEIIGRPGEDVLALAFAGGGFDTALQLGVIHALLVSDGRPPDVVAGISAGAVNAAALAEILQAGIGLPEEKRVAAQVARFRQVLDAFQQSPGLLDQAFLPDPYEVEFHKPLQPVDLPIHHKQEREYREDFSRERSGLIALINDLLTISIPARVITQAVRRILGLTASANERWAKRWATRFRHFLGLWWMWILHLVQISPLVGVFLRSWGSLIYRRIYPRIPFRRLLRSGSTAGSIILGWRLKRALVRASSRLVSLLAAFLLWLVPLFLLGWPWLWISWRRPAWIWLVWLVVGSGSLAFWLARRHLIDVLLQRYHLLNSLASPHPLRQVFVQLFDSSYYGPIHLSGMLEAALQDEASAERDQNYHPRKLREFAERGIHVAPVAADIETGKLTVLHGDLPVVDALLAAMAITPLLPAQTLEKEDGGNAFYIDGINVANEPTSVLMDLLRRKIHPKARRVRVFAVSSLPVSRSSLPDSKVDYQGLVPVVQRVFALKRFRDAYLERHLTKIHTRVADLYVRTMNRPDLALQEAAGQQILRADIYGIEPESPLDLNQRLAEATSAEQRRRLIIEAVAEGCRSALETMIQPAIQAYTFPGGRSCRGAIGTWRGAKPHLPGSQLGLGPGIAEVCQACPLNRGVEAERTSLRALADRADSVWPRRIEVGVTARFSPAVNALQDVHCKPQPPQVALLFSGGVFRGVFQMGSIAALSELDAKPRIFAGASVGSITAAMAARLFAAQDRKERTRRIGLLAATYLTLDRLVLTDRFADFVRRFTLRAGAAEFSVADADRFLRRYDQGTTWSLGRSARRVVSGLERLFYLTPFELLDLVRALRLGKTSDVVRQFVDTVQDFLNRFEVGQEILGSEPLAFLIAHHVLTDSSNPCETFASLTGERATLLAVSTNLTLGMLEILPGLEASESEKAVVLEALLASSAFPGVFRPRWSWEVFPRSSEVCQYVDGGVMDNLPLEAVVQYLDHRAKEEHLSPRPSSPHTGRPVPHLLFAASLEPKLCPPRDAARVAENWLELRARARQLGYNRKIDGFRAAQKRFRAVYESMSPPAAGEWKPLDIEVVTVKPEWLCNTFGFHPMLGFRKKKQAQNIAHGCAMTLGTLYAAERQRPDWFQAWGLRSLVDGSENSIEEQAVQVLDEEQLEVRLFPQRWRASGKSRNPGECWFRHGVLCPFSRARTRLDTDVTEVLGEELDKIYELCGEVETHRLPKSSGRFYDAG
jgi:predicted acylesterase/phospholipase RssA